MTKTFYYHEISWLSFRPATNSQADNPQTTNPQGASPQKASP